LKGKIQVTLHSEPNTLSNRCHSNSKQQTANSKQQTANSKQQSADSRQQTVNSRRPVTWSDLKNAILIFVFSRFQGASTRRTVCCLLFAVCFPRCLQHPALPALGSIKTGKGADDCQVIRACVY
jgi:hypothetical protein